MLLSVKDQGQGRRRRSYSHGSVYGSKLGRSSKLSLLSAITAQSSGSNGSNSTVTQESYNKSRTESSKRRKSSRRKKDDSPTKGATMEAVEEASLEGDADEKPDVFAYLVEEDGQRVRKERVEPPEDTPMEPEPVPYPEEGVQEHDFSSQSFHSDSGISMDDGSYVLGKTTLQPLLQVRPEDQEEDVPRSGLLSRQSRWRWPEVPKPKYQPEPAPICEASEAVEEDDYDHDHDHHNERDCNSPSLPSVFAEDYPDFPLSTDHLASELANSTSPPLFKSFRKTNYRILLQLQDEITELQDELAHLDTVDGSRRLSKDAGTSERLRRLSWQWGQRDFDLYAAKAEIMGKLQIRMDQYYHTLSLSRKVHGMQSSSQMSSENIEKYRKWLQTHLRGSGSTKSEAGSELRFDFLDDEKDLITLQSGMVSSGCLAHLPLLDPTCLLTLIVPLLLFKVFAGVINRLIIVGSVLALGLFISQSEQPGARFRVGNNNNNAGKETTQKIVQQGMIVCASISVVVGLLF